MAAGQYFPFMHKQGLSKVGGFWSGRGWAAQEPGSDKYPL